MILQVKIAEFVGESKKDWQDAIKNAVQEASQNLQNISGVEVYNWTANCQNNQIVEYKANIKIAYTE
ncbi:MAG: dodecin family protein [Syntrophomonas sp.]|jgi:flavin-binding protein dodecin